jgi:hypothetical protein
MVQITIHQGRVTQIDATEKIRVEKIADGQEGSGRSHGTVDSR